MGYIDVSNETNRRVGTSDEEEHGHDRPGRPLSGGSSCSGPLPRACDLWALGYRPRRHCGCVRSDEFRRGLPALHPAEAVDGDQAVTPLLGLTISPGSSHGVAPRSGHWCSIRTIAMSISAGPLEPRMISGRRGSVPQVLLVGSTGIRHVRDELPASALTRA